MNGSQRLGTIHISKNGVVIAFQNKAFDNLYVITFSFSINLIESVSIKTCIKVIIDKRLQI